MTDAAADAKPITLTDIRLLAGVAALIREAGQQDWMLEMNGERHGYASRYLDDLSDRLLAIHRAEINQELMAAKS